MSWSSGFQKGSLPFIQTNDIASVLLVEKKEMENRDVRKREWVLKAFRGEVVDRVPVGFWHHFTSEEEWLKGFSNPVIIEKNIQGHKHLSVN